MPVFAQPLEVDEAQLCRPRHEQARSLRTRRRSVLECQGQTSLKQWTRQPATRKEAVSTTVATRSYDVGDSVSPRPTNLMCVSQTCFIREHMLHRGLAPAWATNSLERPLMRSSRFNAFEPVGGTLGTHLRQDSNRDSWPRAVKKKNIRELTCRHKDCMWRR